MTTTERNPNPRHPIAALIRNDQGKLVGRVIRKPATFEAQRRHGEPGVDIRRVAPGFRSLEAAAAWIARTA